MSLSSKSYEWIVFDAVGTLIYPTPSVAETYQTIGKRFGSQLPIDEIRRRFRQAFYNSEAADCDQESGLITSELIETQRWRRVVAEVLDDVNDSEACFEELFTQFGLPTAWACFDDVQPTLAALISAEKNIAIASNFDRRLNSVCDGNPPLDQVHVRVVSSLVGYRKPSPLFFSAMLNLLNTTADNVLIIGDDPTNDIQGPLAVGIDALQIDRASPGNDRVLNDLTDLIDRLSL